MYLDNTDEEEKKKRQRLAWFAGGSDLDFFLSFFESEKYVLFSLVDCYYC